MIQNIDDDSLIKSDVKMVQGDGGPSSSKLLEADKDFIKFVVFG